MNLRPDRGTILLCGALAAVVAGYLTFVFVPQRRTIDVLYTELQTKRLSILDASMLPLRTQQIERSLESCSRYIDEHCGGELTSPEMARLFAPLADRIQRSGAVSTVFRPTSATRFEVLTQVPVELGCRGTLSEVFQALEGIEQLSQPIWVQEVRLERADKDDDRVECQLNLVIFAIDSESSG